ncbi:hypothetical protein B566_EDAN005899 [Ephemera danica]|nr:hypothetical protein B566_EDAN005899 [Ephemera danica]
MLVIRDSCNLHIYQPHAQRSTMSDPGQWDGSWSYYPNYSCPPPVNFLNFPPPVHPPAAPYGAPIYTAYTTLPPDLQGTPPHPIVSYPADHVTYPPPYLSQNYTPSPVIFTQPPPPIPNNPSFPSAGHTLQPPAPKELTTKDVKKRSPSPPPRRKRRSRSRSPSPRRMRPSNRNRSKSPYYKDRRSSSYMTDNILPMTHDHKAEFDGMGYGTGAPANDVARLAHPEAPANRVAHPVGVAHEVHPGARANVVAHVAHLGARANGVAHLGALANCVAHLGALANCVARGAHLVTPANGVAHPEGETHVAQPTTDKLAIVHPLMPEKSVAAVVTRQCHEPTHLMSFLGPVESRKPRVPVKGDPAADAPAQKIPEEPDRKQWIRSTPADLFYTPDVTNPKVMKGTARLEELCVQFKEKLVDRAAKAREGRPVYEPPPRRHKPHLHKCRRMPGSHKPADSSSSCSSDSETSSSSEDEADCSMRELERKRLHPDRLHPELWFNDPGEMNDGPLCRCSAKAQRSGIRHGIYAGELPLPPCDPSSNNLDRLYHYRITIAPPTNFLTKVPTIIGYDGHEFIFEGFSMFSHSPLASLPICKVIRFNIQYAIVYVEEKSPENFTIAELSLFYLDFKAAGDKDGCPRFHFMPRFVRDLPEIVHFGIRPPQLSYAGNAEYQREWREYVKLRHLVANMPKPSFDDKRRLESKENKLQEMRMQNRMKRDHAMLVPVLVCHLRFHQSLDTLEKMIEYKFTNRYLLQLALTHPSYRENFGTNPDHARNSLTNCGIRQPEYGDRRIHYLNTRKRGINTLINIMSRFGKKCETESNINHNERLEFLGDAVVEFISSIHLFYMFPDLEEGGLATYRAAIVQNQHLAVLAKTLKLEEYMLYAHGSDLCHDLELRHAMANCFEALMGALFLDGGIDVADKVFAITFFNDDPDNLDVWINCPKHPLQEQEPDGDRHWISQFKLLEKLTQFEEDIGIEFNHIRLLARAFTDRSIGYNNLTLGSNQRLEFLGDTVLQLIASDYLYKHFPEHHEGHLSLLRSSLVNNRTQSVVCDDLGMPFYAFYSNPKAELKTKDRADLLEAFLGALYVDMGMKFCETFCNVCFFPRLQDFIMNQDWNDPKSKLQQCCLTLRTMDGGEPDIPVYKVIECKGPTNTRVYSVAVYFRGEPLFPQLNHQKRVIAKSMKKQRRPREGPRKECSPSPRSSQVSRSKGSHPEPKTKAHNKRGSRATPPDIPASPGRASD